MLLGVAAAMGNLEVPLGVRSAKGNRNDMVEAHLAGRHEFTAEAANALVPSDYGISADRLNSTVCESGSSPIYGLGMGFLGAFWVSIAPLFNPLANFGGIPLAIGSHVRARFFWMGLVPRVFPQPFGILGSPFFGLFCQVFSIPLSIGSSVRGMPLFVGLVPSFRPLPFFIAVGSGVLAVLLPLLFGVCLAPFSRLRESLLSIRSVIGAEVLSPVLRIIPLSQLRPPSCGEYIASRSAKTNGW